MSNLIGHLLDSRLARFAKQHKCTYSRYADDITFSTSRRNFPPELANAVDGHPAAWQLGKELREKIEHSGFNINDKKTRMQFRASRQVATGLMVNDKVNIRPEYWRAARQMCHELFKTGTYYRKVPGPLIGGLPTDPPAKDMITTPNILWGMLAHIHQVKDRADFRKEVEKRDDPTAARILYHRFLFYRNFIAPDQPVVVPEGKTNSVYLRIAIRRIPSLPPILGETKSGKFEPRIRFMRYSDTQTNIMELGRGVTRLHALMESYKKNASRFQHCPFAYPVIVLVDNDDGGKKLFGLAKSMSKEDISLVTSKPFYHLGLNLYLVKTPERVIAPHTSCIEDLFDQSVLGSVVNGKVFDPDKDHEEEGKYGKQIFATKVIQPNANSIDFAGFLPLMDQFAKVLQHHEATQAQPLADSA